MSTSEKIYSKLPVFAQNFACSLYGYAEKRKRMGKDFRKAYNDILQTERVDKSVINEYQNLYVKKIVQYAYKHTFYYKKLFDKLKINPLRIKSVSDLKQIPVLTKAELRKNYEYLISNEYNVNNLITYKTSGTTGTPITIVKTREAVNFQWAIWWRHRKRFGVDPFSKHLNFTGKRVVPLNQNHTPYWRWNKPMNQALVNMQHITPDKIKHYATFVDSQSFEFFSGYPSIISEFCRGLLSQNIKLKNPPKFIFTGAENIQEFQYQQMKEATGALISDQYGFAEGCGNASKCEYNNYHEDWEFGVLECHKPEIVNTSDIRGSILATGFMNKAFPLLRYEVGDYALWKSESYVCPCGRSSKVIGSIEGRVEDYVLTPEGTRIMRFDYIFKGINTIQLAQIIQKELTRVEVLVVKSKDYHKRDEETLRRNCKEWISPTLSVDIVYVESIPTNPNGKFKPVVNKLR